MQTKFYTYYQNNSGGHYIENSKKGLDTIVIIEALDSDHANMLAERIGIYFDGVEHDQDCPCCGDRWHRAEENDGTDSPEIYGDSINTVTECWRGNHAFIHYLDKSFEKVMFKKKG